MRILKWLFHPVNIIIVIILFVVFLNRQSLFPEMSGSSEMKQLAKRVDSVAERMERSDDAAGTAAAVPDFEEKDSSPQYSSAPEHAEVKAKNSEVGSRASMQPEPPRDDVEERTTANVQQLLSPSPGKAQKQADAPQRVEPRVLLADARRAAWYGDLPAAVSRYKALIAIQPDNYDAYGEMGNVFLTMGDAPAAATAYASSAELLQQAGYPQAAWQLWTMVSRLDQQKARELYRLLNRQTQPDAGEPR